ncbi:MAG: glycosyltransferase [Clostridia bacterium]|nr:glycosyltransferase [Clostridia bacterium]
MNNDKMNIIFLSRTVPDVLKETVFKKQKGSMPSAAVVFQKKLIDGIEKNIGKSVSLFNLMPVYSYPKNYSDIFIKAESFSHNVGADDYNAGFFNLVYLKRLFLSKSYIHQFKKYFKRKQCDTIICYSADMILLNALKWAKKHFPQIKTCVIIPDMPEFIDLSIGQSLIKRLYNKYLARQTRKMIPYVDSFVYLTEQSADYFCKDKPFTVVEGIASETPDVNDNVVETTVEKVILYTGTTNVRFGIQTLIEAFEKIESPDYRLVICGCGDYDKVITEKAKEDKRIRFYGIVPNEKIISLQKAATVLVNPRQNVDEFTKYSFPSKNMEYLSSGVPLVAYKLDGVPEEYNDYIIYVDDNSPQSLSRALKDVCEWDETRRREFGQAAKEFVLTRKNAVVQTGKIISLLNEI